MAILGLVLFLFLGGLFVSALNLGLTLLLTAFWPGVKVPWRPALVAWLVNAVGITVNLAVIHTWLFHSLTVPTARLLEAGVALTTAAVVSFGVLRLRQVRGWVFFLLLGLLAIPLSVTITHL